MKKLSVDNLNKFIESCMGEGSVQLKLPRTMTYPEIITLNRDKLIDKRFEFRDLFRQNLVAFSKRKEFPTDLLGCLGEKGDNGYFVKWTNNTDDIERFLALSLYTRLITNVERKTVSLNGRDTDAVFVTITDDELQPLVVKE